jgi:hypothetical protein
MKDKKGFLEINLFQIIQAEAIPSGQGTYGAIE